MRTRRRGCDAVCCVGDHRLWHVNGSCTSSARLPAFPSVVVVRSQANFVLVAKRWRRRRRRRGFARSLQTPELCVPPANMRAEAGALSARHSDRGGERARRCPGFKGMKGARVANAEGDLRPPGHSPAS
ncbi:hypothetical protein F2P81_015873 [Scophthalmus maximus]|uniref:Uncharacterized protein n=1 Tax=Scophthalmus maximus TaxID=52904 RepID=A0A6A4SGH6_SCOMX|nr:hypothetical protein F2P81_015873 [Scophthalmus maximus]